MTPMRRRVFHYIVSQVRLVNAVTNDRLKLLVALGCQAIRLLLLNALMILALGWDRTPLYISLLRVLLWAEGLVHQSLDVDQLLYLTVAYDWLLFGYVLFEY